MRMRKIGVDHNNKDGLTKGLTPKHWTCDICALTKKTQ